MLTTRIRPRRRQMTRRSLRNPILYQNSLKKYRKINFNNNLKLKRREKIKNLSDEDVLLFSSKRFIKSVFIISISMGLGDFICQIIKNKSINILNINLERTMTMTSIGLFITGPVSQIFNYILEKKVPGKSLKSILQKICYSSIWGFSVSIPLSFGAKTIFQKDSNGQRGNYSKALNKIKNDLIPTFLVGCFYWPILNMFKFRYIHFQHRPMFNSIFNTIWNIYLSTELN